MIHRCWNNDTSWNWRHQSRSRERSSGCLGCWCRSSCRCSPGSEAWWAGNFQCCRLVGCEKLEWMKRKRRVERAEVGERRNGGSASINRWEGQGKASSMERARWMTGLSVLEKEGGGETLELSYCL